MLKTVFGVINAFFGLISSRKTSVKKGVTIFLRSASPGTLDSDFFPLVRLLSKRFDKVFIIDKSGSFGVARSWIDAICSEFSGEVELLGPEEVGRAIKLSRVVFCKNASGDGLHYRIANFFLRSRLFVLIPHGPTTKPYASSEAVVLPSVLVGSERFLYPSGGVWGLRSLVKNLGMRGYDKIILQNSLEAYRKSLIYAGMKSIDCRGYPRFYRAAYLTRNKSDAICSDEFKNSVSQSGTNILFAPRGKIKIGPEAWEIIQAVCAERDITLHVRMHPQYMNEMPEFVRSSSKVNIVDQSVAPGPVEVLCFMDALITDVSSIMMEGFAYQIPVAHLVSGDEVMAYELPLALPGLVVRGDSELLEFISGVEPGMKDKKSNFISEIFRLDKGYTLEEAYSDLFEGLD